MASRDGKWILEDLPHAQVIRPIDDGFWHTSTGTCGCRPTVRYILGQCFCYRDRGYAYLRSQISHNAMDERAG